MKAWLNILLMAIATCHAEAQFHFVPNDARSAALGGVYLMDETARYLRLDYRQGYAMAGMATRSLSAGWSLGDAGRVAGGYSHFGNAVYHEQQAVASYMMAVSERVSLGVGGGYHHIGTNDAHYESRHWLAPLAMLKVRFGEGLSLYAQGSGRPWRQSRPWRAQVGLQYAAVVGLLTMLELDSDEQLRVRGGVEYCYRESYFFRAGLATAPLVLTFGLGARWRAYAIDLAVERHEHLGLTPQISVALCF